MTEFFIVQLLMLIVHVTCSNLLLDKEWEAFKASYGKEYKSLNEESIRKAIFHKTMTEIAHHNEKFAKGLSSYSQGINYYSDWTWDEFATSILMRPQSTTRNLTTTSTEDVKMKDLYKSPPKSASIDWRELMGSVRNQRSCGSCWAFAAIGVTEGAWAKAGNGKVDLSEQMLIDCDAQGSCDGGWTDVGLNSLIYYGGTCLEQDYPYTASDNIICEYDSSMKAASISSFDTFYVWLDGIDALTSSVADNGPHAIYLYVNDNFRHYSSGIFDDPTCSTTSYNHAVIIVGYDTEEGYWLIRNSWDSTWGDDGHIKIKMGKNVCNCEHYAWVPYV